MTGVVRFASAMLLDLPNHEELPAKLLAQKQADSKLHTSDLAPVSISPIRQGEQSTTLLNELMSYPDVAALWHPSKRSTQNALLLTIHFKRDHLEWKFFSMLATLGTPYDITLQELRIECLFPADEATEQNWQQNGEER